MELINSERDIKLFMSCVKSFKVSHLTFNLQIMKHLDRHFFTIHVKCYKFRKFMPNMFSSIYIYEDQILEVYSQWGLTRIQYNVLSHINH